MNFSLKKTLCLAMLGLTPFTTLYAQDSFVVKKIKVEGLTRISKQTVLNDLAVKIGQNVTASKTNQSIEALYRTGFFKHIQLSKEQNTLVVKVVERAAISSVSFDGNKKIKSKEMNQVLQKAGLDVGHVVDPAVLFQIKQSLLLQYALLGYYSTKVNIDQVKQPRNRVAIKIHILEGRKATVRRINVVGNKAYSQSELLDHITLRTPSFWNLWGVFSGRTTYSPENMQSSTQKLTEYYLDRGYLDFKVSSKQASFSPDKENTAVAFNVDEGEIYKISTIGFAGKFVLPKAEIKKAIKFKAGEVFSRKKVLDSAKSITKLLTNAGYAFATVNPVPSVDKEHKMVGILFNVHPGKKVYVNHINIVGNNVTNDYVYRRQIQYYESGVYNQERINQSKIKLQRLPYVQSVELKKKLVPGSDDLIDMDYHIIERSAGSVKGSIGYSQLYKFIVSGSVNLPDFLGTGNQVSISASLSKVFQSLNLSYTNPFFTQSGISQTISVYSSRTNYSGTSIANYRLNQYGARVNYGVPVSAFTSVTIGGGIDHTKILGPSGGTSAVLDGFKYHNKGKDSFNTLTLNLGIARDTTNRAFFPTSGTILSLHGTASVPGNTLQWYKINSSFGLVHSIIGDTTLSVKGGVGYGNGYGKTNALPFFQNFYGGGWGSVRGFDQGGLGSSDYYTPNSPAKSKAQKGSAVGGNLNMYTNVDLLFPVPGVKDSSRMRLGFFVDGGNVYNTYSIPSDPTKPQVFPKKPHNPTFKNLRYSTGIEFRWLSPVGALAFSLAKPIFNSGKRDATQIFQFTLGQNF